MLSFPSNAKFGKMIPKDTFYKNLKFDTEQKEQFSKYIKKVVWEYKLSESTTNITASKNVVEIQVLRIELKSDEIDLKLLKTISTKNSNKVLYMLCYEEDIALAVCVDKVYITDWQLEEDIELKIKGIDLGVVWDNFIEQIAIKKDEKENNKEKIDAYDDIIINNISIEEKLAQQEKHNKLLKEIEALENKMYKCKQFNKQVEMKHKLEKLREML